jgi:hypothetical protein
MIVLTAINLAMPALALSTGVQQVISPGMKGFALTSDGCCPEVSSNLNGKIATGADGTRNLLQQSGTITIGSTPYNIQFTPNKSDVQAVNNGCSLGTIFNQSGDIELTGSDGTIIKGTGVYSWGTLPDCSGGTFTFTNFSGEIRDSKDQMTKFFTGTDLLPTFQ